MALVIKVKLQDTVRRWIACETVDEVSFSLTLQEVEFKIKKLFNLSHTSVLVITYVDKDNDIITLGDDKDLVDAFFIQHLNPLSLEVQVHEDKSLSTPPKFIESGSIEMFLKTALPEASVDKIKQFLSIHAPALDLKVPVATLLQLVQECFKEFLHEDSGQQGQRCQLPLAKDEHVKHENNTPPVPFPENHITGSSAFSSNDSVHHGIKCDLCWMHPIRGPRYKSTRVQNYDLCSSCFEGIGNKNDYQKVVTPEGTQFRGLRSWLRLKGPRSSIGSPWWWSFARHANGWEAECPFSGQLMKRLSPEVGQNKLDARFLKDVTIPDGTEVAPGTKFTKIWRLKNNGTISWPRGTRLMHFGGDRMGSDLAVTLELPESGLLCGQDFDASINFIAPERAGHYISSWYLMSPSGDIFGHGVWVDIRVSEANQASQLQGLFSRERIEERKSDNLIHADNEKFLDADMLQCLSISDVEVESDNHRNLDTEMLQCLSIPDDKEVESDKQKILDAEMLQCVSISDDGEVESNCPTCTSTSENLIDGDKQRTEDPDIAKGLLINDASDIKSNSQSNTGSISNGACALDATDNESQQESGNGLNGDEIDGFSLVNKPMDNHFSEEQLMPEVHVIADGGKLVRESLAEDMVQVNVKKQLQVLEAIGFTNQELNTRLLEKNNHNLQQTLDELLVSAGWDGVLRDLQGLGFNDHLTNVRLLIKNGGVMKQVVKDLLAREKAEGK